MSCGIQFDRAVSMSDGNAVSDAIAPGNFGIVTANSTRPESHSPAKTPSLHRRQCCLSYGDIGRWAEERRLQAHRQPSSGATADPGITLELRAAESPRSPLRCISTWTISRPAVDITFTPDHSLIAKDYAAAAEANESLLDEWLPQAVNARSVIELTDPNANPYQDGATLFTPLRSAIQPNLQLLFLPMQVAARFPTPRPWIQDGLGFSCKHCERERGGRRAALQFLDQYQLPWRKPRSRRSGSRPEQKRAPTSDSDNTLSEYHRRALLARQGRLRLLDAA